MILILGSGIVYTYLLTLTVSISVGEQNVSFTNFI